MKLKGATCGMHELETAICDALGNGINFAIKAESQAWARVNELEDLVVGIIKHAPGSDLARARELALSIKSEQVPVTHNAGVSGDVHKN